MKKVWKIIKITVLIFIVFTSITLFIRNGVKYIKISDRKINTTYVFPDSIQQELNVIAPFIIHEKINDAVGSYLGFAELGTSSNQHFCFRIARRHNSLC